MTKSNRVPRTKRLERFAGGGIALILGIALAPCWKSGTLYAAGEAENATANSRTAAVISDLREKIQGELDRIEAVEHRLDSIEHPEDAKGEVMQLREEIRSERARVEAMETTLNELAELAPPPFAVAPADALAPAPPAAPPAQAAEAPLPTLTVGAGIQGSYQHIEPDGGKGVDQFSLGHARIYMSGDITNHVSAMFNTDYDSATNKMGIMDAVGEIHASPKFNIWFGRFLPPSDRADLYGPFYSHQWGFATDGIQDGYPFIFQGRDDGVAYWGDFNVGKTQIKFSLGGFDGGSATGNSDVLGAARVQIDFWDPEGGYYLNGTYYGDKNLLAIGAATQWQSGNTATTLDFLMERKLPKDNGVFSIESEYSNYNRLGGYDANYAKSQGAYALASYLFPKPVGIGKFEILGKYAIAEFTHGLFAVGTSHPSYRQKTAEVNLNYIIKQFDARLMSFYRDTRFNTVNKDSWEAGVGLQVQLSKQIH